ncbi:hypothetical protein RF679_06625 [Undibacterium cyanobacteriorum]|uniref:Lysozyme inhibitor LprI N-terminal domain-containing protein n=1 Tax=Undibacterium cyanobacteriorum TaxID=3073561 RepID=A0ABY9RMM8_9BURK|nr:hypothetical protein [Undibacterium sp. 20NA77.5]WMW81954.1 hypothetical protein RF679_06625 [Undibacterium sp. 20NA77.5]
MQKKTLYTSSALLIVLVTIATFTFFSEPNSDQAQISTTLAEPKLMRAQSSNVGPDKVEKQIDQAPPVLPILDINKGSDDEICRTIGDHFQTHEAANENQAQDKNFIKTLQAKVKADSPLESAAALFLLAQKTDSDVSDSLHSKCGDEKACHDMADTQAEEAVAKYIDEIAKLAIRSNSPQLYAMAFQGCQRVENSRPASCKQITAEQWAQRDPENGRTWLYVLLDYRSKANAVSTDSLNNALFRLSQAKNFNSGLPDLIEFSHAIGLQSNDYLSQYQLLDITNASLVRSVGSPYNAVRDFCSTEHLNTNDRNSVCSGIAEKFATVAGSEQSLYTAEKLGQQLSWPNDKINKIHDQFVTIRKKKQANIELENKAATNDHHSTCLKKLRKARALNLRLQIGDAQFHKMNP